MSNNTSDIDLYAILELDPDATVETIKKAYKRLALQYHPDRPNGDTIKFQEIAMAYEILSNPEKRGEYDLLRQQRHSPQSHGLHSFYQKNTSFDPFDIFQEIFGEFLDFMILESSQFSSMPQGLEDILYMANMFGEGSIHIQRLEPMFEIAQRTVNLFQHGSPILQHSPTQIPLSSNISSALHPLQAPQLQPPKDLIQTITVDLREIYQGKTKKFNVTRLRFDDKIFKGKKMIEIPLFQKQIRIPKEGDWLPSWEGPGDLVINILATSALGFYRVNDFDLFTYHKVPLEEWYQGFTSVTLLDDTKITIDLAQQYQTLSETNFLLKMPNLGLPKSSSKESTCDRGYLYIQFILLPPGQQSTIADPSLILEILNYDE